MVAAQIPAYDGGQTSENTVFPNVIKYPRKTSKTPLHVIGTLRTFETIRNPIF